MASPRKRALLAATFLEIKYAHVERPPLIANAVAQAIKAVVFPSKIAKIKIAKLASMTRLLKHE